MSGTPGQTPPQMGAFLAALLAQKAASVPPIPDIFANQIRMGVTLTDFAVIFGTAEGTPTGQAFMADKVVIHMAPGMLKQLSLHLSNAIDAYEEAIGKIVMPKYLGKALTKLREDLVIQLKQQMEKPVTATYQQQTAPSGATS